MLAGLIVSVSTPSDARETSSKASPPQILSETSNPLTPSHPPVSGTDIASESESRAAPVNLPIQLAAAPTIAYEWNMILQNYMSEPASDGLIRFNYKALKANDQDMAKLEAYIESLENTDPTLLPDDEAVVFWANLYNAVTIKVVLDNYPVSSIRKIKSGLFSIGPWKKDLVTINGQKMSLDDIEHDTMRKQFDAPLVHYMVNCASIGCPNLKPSLWTAQTLEADQDQAARDFINSPRGVKITERGLRVSSIYSWFKKDFGGNNAGVLEHLRQYADEDLAAAIDGGAKIISHDYDWSLNE